MKLINIFIGLLALSNFVSGNHFQNFLEKYNKHYISQVEYSHRENVFNQNLELIESFNSKQDSFTLGINEYTDLTHDEFVTLKKFHPFPQSELVHHSYQNILTNDIDWRDASKNPKKIVAVNPVKNQEQCGSCWAFSSTSATESAWAISGKPLTSLSEQELVDCSSSFGNNGCSGGLMDDAFKFIIKHGQCTEKDYPYKAADGSCRKCTPVAHLSGFIDITSGNETGILEQLQSGTVSVAIEADQAVFQFYTGGVLDDASCGTQLDHGVVVVGAGSDNGKDYWIVRNSWGSSWGENGYVRIVRGKNMCGISQMASRPYVTSENQDINFPNDLKHQHCASEIIHCMTHYECRKLVEKSKHCHKNITCLEDIINNTNNSNFKKLVSCEIKEQPTFEDSLSGVYLGSIWSCVGKCGAGIIGDVISCAGDLSHIWDVVKCVGHIVGTFTSCGKCICSELGKC